MRRLQWILIALFPLILLDARPAAANRNAFGIRGGVTDDLDTVFMGGHVVIRPGSARRLLIEPSLEFGVADNVDLFTIRGNLNFKFLFPVGSHEAFYPLFGPSLYYYNYDNCIGDGCDDSNVGLNLGMGFMFSGLALEISLGIPDGRLPDFAVTLSYTFF